MAGLDLPPSPSLPLLKEPSAVLKPRFKRLSQRLPSSTWSALRSKASDQHLTPSAILLNAYASVLSQAGSQPELSLNVTFFDRKPVHPHIDRVVGDFTSLFVLAWQSQVTWAASATALQQRLQQDMTYRDVSSIQVMRYLAQERGVPVSFPVVFTSALGYERGEGLLSNSSWLKPLSGISQTPQVWLDHQVYESDGELVLNWDYVSELLDSDWLQSLFDQYTSLLVRLSADEQAWQMTLDELLPRVLPSGNLLSPLPTTSLRTPSPTHDHALVKELCSLFADDICSIAPQQNFFDAGASSLDLVRFHLKLTQAGYPNLSVTDLFSHPSPNALASWLAVLEPKNETHHISSSRQTLLTQRVTRRERRVLASAEAQD